MQPLPAARALDQFFFDTRARLLDIAATLDRIQRGDGADAVASDPRAAKLHEAVGILASDSPNKAELIQQLFSLAYDPDWKRPQPRF